MTVLKVKRFAVRDAQTMKRLGSGLNWFSADQAQREADKLIRKGKSAIVVPVEE